MYAETLPQENSLREPTAPEVNSISTNLKLAEDISVPKSSPLNTNQSLLPKMPEYIQPNPANKRFFQPADPPSGTSQPPVAPVNQPGNPTLSTQRRYFNEELVSAKPNFFSSSLSQPVEPSGIASPSKPVPTLKSNSEVLVTSPKAEEMKTVESTTYAQHHRFQKSTNTISQENEETTIQEYLRWGSNVGTLALLILMGGAIIYINTAPAEQVKALLSILDPLLNLFLGSR